MIEIAEYADDLIARPRSERVAQLFSFEPFDYQADVLDADARRLTWVCGRQVGQTETASIMPADYALMHIEYDFTATGCNDARVNSVLFVSCS